MHVFESLFTVFDTILTLKMSFGFGFGQQWSSLFVLTSFTQFAWKRKISKWTKFNEAWLASVSITLHTRTLVHFRLYDTF